MKKIEMRTKSKTIPIFSLKVALHLMQNGFVLRAVRQNEKIKGWQVYYFDNSQNVCDEVNKFLANSKEKEGCDGRYKQSLSRLGN